MVQVEFEGNISWNGLKYVTDKVNYFMAKAIMIWKPVH